MKCCCRVAVGSVGWGGGLIMTEIVDLGEKGEELNMQHISLEQWSIWTYFELGISLSCTGILHFIVFFFIEIALQILYFLQVKVCGKPASSNSFTQFFHTQFSQQYLLILCLCAIFL